MQFTVIERITLMSVLPEESNFVTLRILRDMKKDLSFTEKEIKDFNVVINKERVTWDQDSEPADGVEISIGEKAMDIIAESLKGLDEQKKLTDQHFSLCEKFLS